MIEWEKLRRIASINKGPRRTIASKDRCGISCEIVDGTKEFASRLDPYVDGDIMDTCEWCMKLPGNKGVKRLCPLTKIKNLGIKHNGKYVDLQSGEVKISTIFDSHVQNDLAEEIEKRISSKSSISR